MRKCSFSIARHIAFLISPIIFMPYPSINLDALLYLLATFSLKP